MGDRRRKKKRSWWKDSADGAGDAAEAGVEIAGDGCLGCDISLMIALALLAGIPLLLWTG